MAESEEVKEEAVSELKRSSLQIPRVLNRLNELPILNSLCEKVSDIYGRTRERNVATQLGFSAVEVTAKAFMVTTRFTYSNIPESGLVGKLKEGFEEKVSQVDTMACGGLEFLQNKWPIIKDDTNKIMAVGAEKLEQSDLAEVLLSVTEAAVDYFKPPEEKRNKTDNDDPPVVQTKVDRIRRVRHTLTEGGAEVLSLVTSAGLQGAKTATEWSWNITQSLLQKLPVVNHMLSTFLDSAHSCEFLFLPPILGEGGSREILGRKQKLRRSKRYKIRGDYHRIVDASEPFPVSPDRKRKYDKEEGEGALIEELIHVSENYVSDEDPDYVPENDAEEDSESSEDDDDDDDDDENDEDEDEADEDEELDESDAKTSKEREATVQASPQETTHSEIIVEVNGMKHKEDGGQAKPNISNKTDADNGKEASVTGTRDKGIAEAAKVDDKSTEKESAARKDEGRIVI